LNRCGPVFDLINILSLSMCSDSRASSDSQCPVPAQDRVMIVPSTASLDMRFKVDEVERCTVNRGNYPHVGVISARSHLVALSSA
jgi:hypothetical protein